MPAAVRLAILLAVPSGGPGWLLAVQEDGQASRSGVVFTEVTRKAGIDFQHANAATGEKYLIETMGPGCAFLDYDADGYLDIFFRQRSGPSRLCTGAAIEKRSLQK